MQNKIRFIHPIKSSGGGKDSGLSVIILAARPGYRMRSFGPKCLIKDKNGVSLIQHQAEIINTEFNKVEIILVGGFEFDKIVKNKLDSVRLVENQLHESSNEICDLRLGINNAMYENILVLFGDIMFSPSVLKNITKKSTLVLDNNNHLLEDDVGATVVENKITIMSMSIKETKWAKIAYFTDKEYKLLKQFVLNRDNEKMFLFEAINFLLENGCNFESMMIQGNEIFVHVDSTKELEKIL